MRERRQECEQDEQSSEDLRGRGERDLNLDAHQRVSSRARSEPRALLVRSCRSGCLRGDPPSYSPLPPYSAGKRFSKSTMFAQHAVQNVIRAVRTNAAVRNTISRKFHPLAGKWDEARNPVTGNLVPMVIEQTVRSLMS